MIGRRDSIFGKKRRNPLGFIALFLAGIIGILSLYTVVDNGRIVVRTQNVLVADLPASLEGFTVLLISDLNGTRFGPAQKMLQGAFKNRKYHAVCLVGDMIGPKGDIQPLMELLSALDPTRPVFFIAGDSDPGPSHASQSGYYAFLPDWISTVQARGATYLDSPGKMTVGTSTVWFTNAEYLALDLDTAIDAYNAQGTRESAYRAEALSRLKAARDQMLPQDLHITVSHRPLKDQTVLSMQNAGDSKATAFLRSVDVILAGGTAGGQWRLPLIGPVWYDGWFPKGAEVYGYHRVGSLLQVTTGGLGVPATSPLPPFRLLNTPEITLVTFTSEIGDDPQPN